MSTPPPLFDRATVRRHRDRAAAGYAAYAFLFEEVAARLAERVEDATREFPRALDLGCHGGEMARHLRGRKGIETLVSADLSPALAALAPAPRIACDEEFLPFAEASLDLVVSNLSLHWVNDLPGALVQIRRALKPDGLFVASLLGGDTLVELRAALAEAEIAEEGGLSPRLSPLVDLRTAAGLLQRAGFALPVADLETITVSYGHPLHLMTELRGMGESNAVHERRKTFTRRATLSAAARAYIARHAGGDGRVPATFQVITLTAWAPHPDQPRPLKPGSATHSLEDALNPASKSAPGTACGLDDGPAKG